MNRQITTALSCLALSLPALAQEADKPKTQTTPRPALILKTADPMLSMGVLAQFDPDAVLTELGENQHHEIVVATDGKVVTRSVGGEVGWLQLTAYPPALMQLYGKQIDQSWEMIRDTATLGLTQMGISARQGAIVMQAIRDFPQQLRTVEVAVTQNPRTQLKGTTVTIAVSPTADSWMGKVVKQLRPHDQGAPLVTVKDPMISMGMAVHPDGIRTLVEPFLGVMSHLGTKNKKERSRLLGIYSKMIACQDGTFYSAGDPFGGTFRGIAGLRDPEAFKEMVANGDYGAMTEMTAKISPMIDTEFEAEAFTHRDVAVMKMTMMSDIDTPSMPSGEQISYTAVAAGYMVTATAEKPEVTKQLIDAALDQKIKRQPLPGGALMVMELRLMDLLDKVSPIGNPFAGQEDQAPQKARVTVNTKGGSLNLTLELR